MNQCGLKYVFCTVGSTTFPNTETVDLNILFGTCEPPQLTLVGQYGPPPRPNMTIFFCKMVEKYFPPRVKVPFVTQ